MRNHFVVDDPAVLRLHDHAAWRGHGPADLDLLAASAFTAGADRNERMMFVCDDPDPDRLRISAALDRLLDDGVLTLSSVDDVYGGVETLDAAAQLQSFVDVLDESLALGYAGIRVVADNTSLVCGDDDSFMRWLAWEQTADRFQSERPVIGICYFDSGRLDADRLDVLGTVHPVTGGTDTPPPFQVFVDNGVVAVTGEIDADSIDIFRRSIAGLPRQSPFVVDVTRAAFIDHRALIEFGRLATQRSPVQLQGVHPNLRRLWHVLGLSTYSVQFT